MGKKLDALFGKKFKVNKFKALLSLAISRIAILKNMRQVKCTQARSDVVQLLELGHHEQALIRVEQVIKEQNMLDVLVMAEGYCSLLIERVHVIEQERECPEELREAISGLLFASSRVGEFPELIEIRTALTSKYGKGLVARSIELRNNCGVNPKMVQKLSTRQPGLENRMKVLKEIAAEKSIPLKLDEGCSSITEETPSTSAGPGLGRTVKSGGSKLRDDMEFSSGEMASPFGLSDSMNTRKKYKDVADAAQEAFRSAAYAAEAARAAVELSRADAGGPDDDGNNPNYHKRRPSDRHEPEKPESESRNESDVDYQGTNRSGDAADSKRSASAMSTDSDDAIVEVPPASFREQDPVKLLEKDVVIYDSDEDRRAVGSVMKSRKVMDDHAAHLAGGSGMQPADALKGDKMRVSVRTRQVRGY